MDSDRMLIYQMRQGNDQAWEQFVRKYYGDIHKYCAFHCGDRALAEDLTQEVFLRFFSALAVYQHQGKAKNYLYTIAGNLCITNASKNREQPLEPFLDSTAAADGNLNDRLILMDAIRRLPEELRGVVVLHYLQGLKLSEAAAVLKIGLPLVKYRIKRAKELLRKELEYESESSIE